MQFLLTIPSRAPVAPEVASKPLAGRPWRSRYWVTRSLIVRDQRIELFERGGIDPMKSQLSIAHGRKEAINKQHVKIQIQFQS